MQTRFLKSTTAILLALSVAVPAPAVAQQSAVQDEVEKVQKKLQEELDKVTGKEKKAEEGEVEAEASADGSIESEENSETAEARDEMKPDENASDTAEAATTAAPEATAEAVQETTDAAPQAEATAEAGTEVKPEADAAENAEAPAEAPAETTTTAEGAATTEEPATEQATDATAAPAEETTETAETTGDQPATEQAADATGEPQDTRPAETAEGTQPAADGEVTTTAESGDAPADAETTTTAETEGATTDTEATTTAETGSETTEAETTTTAETDTTAADTEAQERAEAAAGDQPTAESGEAPETMAAQAGEDGGTLIEETVTEESQRSSSEEFNTAVDGQADANAQTTAQAESDDDGGLSTAEKIAVFGLGALAVGALLNNGQRVVSNSGDRVVVEENGTYRVLKNDDVLLRQPGADVKTYAFNDGSTRTVVVNPDGSQVETIRAADGRVLTRTKVLADGRQVVLFDDTQAVQQVAVNELPQATSTRSSVTANSGDEAALRDALRASLATDPGRNFSLAQVRGIDGVRKLAPEVEVDNVNFRTASAVIEPQEAEALSSLGNAMRSAIEENPGEVFLIEGHTDAVGDAGYNLALSDRRAESLALALTEYFNVPPENMVIQGYGEADLKVETASAERQNRRAAVRRITPLLEGRS
ncbi:hypothetical protein ATO6_10545 [Oceanicola sp. 22II-s10i]|uniref:OmpA family protein n=1 Tax=Oceanicola sp. 22II-s10i TaxID=1317116 RepID=UPI000B523007|nr:OmpA family protein [Oceanicola sp. 22II-s10i]OWU84760.1 hypothetical protein ATO6_10545 [Oceanicola sp. 22II-s10i]